MCGRFTITADPAAIQEAFPWAKVPPEMQPRYNVAPSQPVAVIPNDGKNKIDYFIWGLIPSWAKNPAIGNRMINARGETLADKPSFRAAYKRRCCLIIADGFYEWVKNPGQKAKVPYYIQLESQEPFGMAGLWEVWFSPDGSEIKSCTIITTSPNDKISKLHNRMPVILPKSAHSVWLEREDQKPEQLNTLLKAYPAGEMVHHPVSSTVNNPKNDIVECTQPVII
ncbi:MAG: SOS response-associated peptidase [Chloroflexi bacterium]|nr:SOS response-associated peptidase [Chloroflexota bacterium]